MNKAYFLVICLLAASFTGCVTDEVSELEEQQNTEEETIEPVGTTNNETDDYNMLIGEIQNLTDEVENLKLEIEDLKLEIEVLKRPTFQPLTRDDLRGAISLRAEYPDASNAIFGNINTWDTSLITNMSYLFSYVPINGDISDWDTSNVIDMSYMFMNAYNFSQDIGDWDVSSVTDMRNMFDNADSFDQDISDWDISNVTRMGNMFNGADDLSGENKCAIHTSFDSNSAWPYDWESFCSDE